VIWSEEFPCIHVAAAQDDDHVAAHEECGIRLLGVVHGRVVVYLKLLVARIAHQFLKLLAELVDFAEVERAEIGKEGLVN
jgi:hypothetical protein